MILGNIRKKSIYKVNLNKFWSKALSLFNTTKIILLKFEKILIIIKL